MASSSDEPQNTGQGITLETKPDLSQGLIYFGNRICPFAERCRLVFAHHGAQHGTDFTYYHVNLGPTKQPIYKEQIYESATVPLLFVNGHMVEESPICAEYLDAHFSGTSGVPALNPADPLARADIQLFVSRLPDFVKPMYGLLMAHDKRCTPEEREERKVVFAAAADKLEAACAGRPGPFFLGAEPSLADTNLLPFLHRARILLSHYRDVQVLEGRPALAAFYDAACALPAAQATLPEDGFLIKFYAGYALPPPEEEKA